MLARDKVKAIAEFLRKAAAADKVEITAERRLPGATAREHWLLDADLRGGPQAGRRHLVLRGQAEDGGIGSEQEMAIRAAVFQAGVTTPEPLWCEPSGNVIGRPFLLLRHAEGEADPARIQEDLSEEDGDRLAFRLGQELARLHRITMDQAPAALSFLPKRGADWIARRVEIARGILDTAGTPQPTMEWALNWLADHAPDVAQPVLSHRDFRSGKYVIDGDNLVGILDLEQVGWGDPMEDLGSFCARAWRYGLPAREAGGIGSREALYDGYRDASGRDVDDRRVRFWEIAAAFRSGLHALQQRARSSGTSEQGLRNMLTGLRVVEAEYDLLVDIERYEAEAGQ
ncbi:MAG TPA: phosphotransferase family protein [Dongiaceae bacterium]|nr:phosphotransferase family protein [Dongiaceae bacterium]